MKKSLILSFVFSLGMIACSKESDKLALPHVEMFEKVDGEGGSLEVFDPRIDILFVIDNSGSMESHQRNLVANIDKFVKQFAKNAFLDFHVGVLSTDMDGYYSSGTCCGALSGSPAFVTKTTLNLQATLSQNLLLGTSGSGSEKSFEPIMAALSEPLLSRDNAGFYRPDAFLAVIFITDAEDQSRASSRELMDFLLRLKTRSEQVLGYGVIIPSPDSSCQRDDGSRPQKIENFLGMVSNAGSNIMNLCAADYGDRLNAFFEDMVKRVGNQIYLSRKPIVESIKVFFGSQLLPAGDAKKGWVYNAYLNAVVFGKDIDWNAQPNAQLQVYYDAVK